MISKTQKETIKKFFEAVEKVVHGPGEIYDLGLVISDNLKLKDLVKFAPRPEEIEIFDLSEKTSSEFVEVLLNVFKKKKWILVEVVDGYLPEEVYNKLRFLSINNHLQFFDGKSDTDIKIPIETRIIFLINKKSASQINNPNFINLFGPVIKI